jgi:hypothetical protein
MLLSAVLWESTEAVLAVFLLELQLSSNSLPPRCSCLLLHWIGASKKSGASATRAEPSAARTEEPGSFRLGQGMHQPQLGRWFSALCGLISNCKPSNRRELSRPASTIRNNRRLPPTRSSRSPIHNAPYSEPPWRRRRCPHRHAWQVSLPVTWLSSQCAFSRAPKGRPPGALGNQSLVEATANGFAASSATGATLVSDI